MLSLTRLFIIGLFSTILIGSELSATLPVFAKSSLPLVRIGIVLDGPPQEHGFGKMVTEKLFRKAIVELTRGEFDVRFPKPFLVHGNWSVKGVRKALDFLMSQSQVDLVLALGVIATNEAAQTAYLPKPVIGPFVIDAALQALPVQNGRSGVQNLNYLSSFKSFERDLKRFLEIVSIQHLTLIADRAIVDAFPLVQEKVEKAARANEITISLLMVDETIDDALPRLSPKTEAVFITPLFRLFLGLTERHRRSLDRRLM